jgi:hypothetical protein
MFSSRAKGLIVHSFVVSYAESVSRRGEPLQKNTLFPDALFAIPLMSGFFVFVPLLQDRINCGRHQAVVSTMQSFEFSRPPPPRVFPHTFYDEVTGVYLCEKKCFFFTILRGNVGSYWMTLRKGEDTHI